MKLIGIYNPTLGSQSKFLDRYREDSQEIAEGFWNSLNDSCLFFIILLLFVSIGLCIFYFGVYNEMPGRHYKRTHWLGVYIVTLLLTFFGTAALGYMITNPPLPGSGMLIWKIAFANFIYSFVLFGLCSCLWWLIFPTNAYNPLRKR